MQRAVSSGVGRLGMTGAMAVPSPDLRRSARPWILAPDAVEAAPSLAAANRIVAGRYDVFALHDVELGSPPRWNRDPKTGTEAPLGYGLLLDYGNPRLVGDIKYLWEPNGHLHLVTLAQAYDLSGDARYAETIAWHLDSWVAACPARRAPTGRARSSSGSGSSTGRSPGSCWAGRTRRCSKARRDFDLRRRWLESIHQHARFIENHFSRYSSANNHLIEEAAGLFVAGITWPYWPEARCWMERARTILEREALLQNAADGVNLEQAASYQHFVLDLLLLPLLAGRANGVDFPSAYYARIESMLEYLASIMDVGGNVPMIGDVDDALVVKLDHRSDFCPYRSLLATGALLFNRPDFKAKAGRLDDKTRWLLGKEADGAYARIDAGALRLPVKRSFPLGGYYILDAEVYGVAQSHHRIFKGRLGSVR